MNEKREEKVNEIFETLKPVLNERIYEVIKNAIRLGFNEGRLQELEELNKQLTKKK